MSTGNYEVTRGPRLVRSGWVERLLRTAPTLQFAQSVCVCLTAFAVIDYSEAQEIVPEGGRHAGSN